MFFLLLSVIIGSVFILSMKWAEERNKYWDKRKINFIKPKLFFGNSYEILRGHKHSSEVHEAAYKAFPLDEMVGFYNFTTPQLILRKPELIEKVLKNDFSHFSDRVLPIRKMKNPLQMNLFNMCGNQWRLFRHKLSPIFTYGKLKYMFESMSECGDNLLMLLDSYKGKEIDLKCIMELFSVDVIRSCAFGIDSDVLKNSTSNFRNMGKKVFEISNFQFLLISLFPNLASKLNLSIFNPESVKYFCEIILNTIRFRKKHMIERSDFIQLMMRLQSKGKIEVQSSDPVDDYLNIKKWQSETDEFSVTDELLIGAGFGFLFAGFHTTASTLTYALYELSCKPEVLERARNEINDQVSIHGGINIDSLKCMVYLEKIIKETMRLHPAVPSIFRVCTKKYTFPNGLTVIPGDSIIIPIFALQRDPTYYTDPLSFNPDRFNDILDSGTYLPFGEGPRICIAMQFAILEMKLSLSKLLLNYDIQLSNKTETPLKMTPRSRLNIPMKEVVFHITKR